MTASRAQDPHSRTPQARDFGVRRLEAGREGRLVRDLGVAAVRVGVAERELVRLVWGATQAGLSQRKIARAVGRSGRWVELVQRRCREAVTPNS